MMPSASANLGLGSTGSRKEGFQGGEGVVYLYVNDSTEETKNACD
jgi:hypothetical protein